MSWANVFDLWNQITGNRHQNVPAKKAKIKVAPPKNNSIKQEKDI